MIIMMWSVVCNAQPGLCGNIFVHVFFVNWNVVNRIGEKMCNRITRSVN